MTVIIAQSDIIPWTQQNIDAVPDSTSCVYTLRSNTTIQSILYIGMAKKGELKKKIRPHTDGEELEVSSLETFSEPVKDTSATITKTNTIASNSLEVVSEEIETFFSAIMERQSTISTLAENLLATQQDLKLTPEELQKRFMKIYY